MPPTPGISFHAFPRDPKIRKLWVLAIKRDRWQPTSSSRLCSAHFTNEDYVHDPSIAERLGMKPFSRLLKPNAVPSLFAHNRKAENKLRGAFEKRRRKEVCKSVWSVEKETLFDNPVWLFTGRQVERN
ncbi:hypothetical protein HPB50_027180 [Hyalomma asiaticum]|uniref:Uncharacterized protein n=1 Tax=Hyalomma asiaticum TaxID=266040 RepID=A0ACB7RRE4_HYAAI|nr:hypothetical protein HPB50_027180 [Hyalomma asiaticum]